MATRPISLRVAEDVKLELERIARRFGTSPATLGADYRLFAPLSLTTRLGSPVFALLLQALITVAFLLLLGTQAGHDAINQVLVSVQLVKEAPKWDSDDAFQALVSQARWQLDQP